MEKTKSQCCFTRLTGQIILLKSWGWICATAKGRHEAGRKRAASKFVQSLCLLPLLWPPMPLASLYKMVSPNNVLLRSLYLCSLQWRKWLFSCWLPFSWTFWFPEIELGTDFPEIGWANPVSCELYQLLWPSLTWASPCEDQCPAEAGVLLADPHGCLRDLPSPPYEILVLRAGHFILFLLHLWLLFY